MRVFLKNLFRIAGGAIALGIVLLIVALGMDNRVYTKWHRVDLSLGNGWIIWNGDGYDEEAAPTADNVKETEGSTESMYPVSYQNVKSLDFHMFAGKLYIKEGKEFSLDINEEGNKRISSEVKDGIWTLREKSGGQKTADGENNITIFGIDINLSNPVRNKDLTEVYVTIPKGFTADKLALSVDAGTITADSLAANTGSITVGAGTCKINELNVKDSSSYKVDAGMLEIDNGTINNGTMSCAAGRIGIDDGVIHNGNISCMAGSIDINGSITGDSQISASVGAINLKLDGKEEDYNYTIDCNLGTLMLNGTRYSGINKHITQKNSAPNTMTLNCDVGSISMNID